MSGLLGGYEHLDAFPLYITEDGETSYTFKGLALVLGVTVQEIDALPLIDGQVQLPKRWNRRMKARMVAASTQLGTTDIPTILNHMEKVHPKGRKTR